MAGQTFLITGGAGGIGSALARRLVARGDSVALFGRRAEPLHELASELGESALAVPGDAGKLEDLAAAVAAAPEAAPVGLVRATGRRPEAALAAPAPAGGFWSKVAPPMLYGAGKSPARPPEKSADSL